jgi:sugar transferase (PEP-CTERM system associated)
VQLACETLRPHEIVVALDERRNTLPVKTLLACRLRGTVVTPIASFLERRTGKIDPDYLDLSWMLFSDGPAKGAWWRATKRGFDVVVSAAFLAFTLPVTLLVALAIKLEDGGPVFYTQERVGLNGRPFKILKFRSMRVDAERGGVAQWATRSDPRITRLGHFIRRTRIDEIPQVINVLRGEMSFVGPRPERPSIIAEIVRTLPSYEFRHLVKPGITGWAQISYGYGDSPAAAREKLKYDLYYVKNGGLFLDAVILLQTIRVVLFAQGSR